MIVIFRNAGFRRDAGTLAKKMFGRVGTAGGHKSMARAEIPLRKIADEMPDIEDYVLNQIKKSRQDLV